MKTISMSQFGNLNICHYPELDTQARKGSPPFVANKHSFTSPPLPFLHYTKRDHSELFTRLCRYFSRTQAALALNVGFIPCQHPSSAEHWDSDGTRCCLLITQAQAVWICHFGPSVMNKTLNHVASEISVSEYDATRTPTIAAAHPGTLLRYHFVFVHPMG